MSQEVQSSTARLTSPATRPVSLTFLDGARALAALFVVGNHVYLHPPGVDEGRIPYNWHGLEKVLGVLAWGHFAVAFFIVLSGFCLAISPAKRDALPDWKSFLARRARRILPPYYAALAFSLLLIGLGLGARTGTHWDYSLPVTAPTLLYRLLLVNVQGSAFAVNHVFWSIGVEWHLYFLFLPLLWAARRLSWPVLLGVLLPLSYLLARLSLIRLHTDASFAFLFLFVLGMGAAHLVFSPRYEGMRHRWNWLALSLGATGLFVLAVEVPTRHGAESWPFYRLDYFAGLAASLWLVTLCLSPTLWLRRVLEARPLVRIGAFSYSLYLTHAPLIQVLWLLGIARIANVQVQFALLLVASLVVSILFAYAFYFAFERPFLARERRAENVGTA